MRRFRQYSAGKNKLNQCSETNLSLIIFYVCHKMNRRYRSTVVKCTEYQFERKSILVDCGCQTQSVQTRSCSIYKYIFDVDISTVVISKLVGYSLFFINIVTGFPSRIIGKGYR